MPTFGSASIWFGLGVLIEALLLLNTNGRKIEKRDIWGVAACLIGSALLSLLLVLKIFSGNFGASYVFSLFITFAVVFATTFRSRILPIIDEQTLLVWNILFTYAYFTHFPRVDALGVVIILVSLTTLINALSPLSPNTYGKALLYVWFLIMVVFLAVAQFLFGNLTIFASGLEKVPAGLTSGPQILLAGMAFLYIAVNVWWVLRLIPLQREGQSVTDRMLELHADLQLVASKYQTTRFAPLQISTILVLLGGSLVVNHLAQALPDWLLIDFGVATIPFLGSKPNITA